MIGSKRRRRGSRARDHQFTVAVIFEGGGAVISSVTSNHLEVEFADAWVVHGPWYDSGDVESQTSVEVS